MGDRQRNIKLFIGNLPFDATEDNLRDILQGCGQIKFIIVRKNAQTNKSKGFAHVEYRHEHECVEAFKRLIGREINGRVIKVDWCDEFYRGKYPELVAAAAAAYNNGQGNIGFRVNESGFNPPIDHNISQSYTATPLDLSREQQMNCDLEYEYLKRNRFDGDVWLDEHGCIVNKELLEIIKTMTMADIAQLVTKIDGLIAKSPVNSKSVLLCNPKMCIALVHAKILLGQVDVKIPNIDSDTDMISQLFDYFVL
ncbi:bifunctional RNA recognition motif domain/RNA-binding domain superfamily/Nucleotide-binding alpha-beta plait domain superfamily [Babesia duncani]|uniref:Bifunctional RNA recognition motif domain/RNA-binding domain superfamily/Nucleotide-binding alpha-beta plait domain superfamily n=1 Tax=Babesia duncani TaxID=323732 RepID=A0AAD9PMW3_9APIC|nr:bifunctional RNA recognition motif domain/RNA-binding domain superfamily/Nucleotide-binding alpha-beta plait domain superfamily [Babesia duncani]